MAPRSLVIAVTTACLAVVSCGQKQKPENETEPAVQAVPQQGDTTDVFNEFYTEANDTGKKSVPTFSMNEPASYTPAFTSRGAYVTQVATMVSRFLADELATELKEKGYPAYVALVQNPRPELTGTYYRVRIGRFASIEDARAFGENVLKPSSYSFWVDRKSNDHTGVENRSIQSDPTHQAEPVPAQPKVIPTGQSQETAPTPSGNWGSSGWQENSGSW
jgi:hypothetical protein